MSSSQCLLCAAEWGSRLFLRCFFSLQRFTDHRVCHHSTVLAALPDADTSRLPSRPVTHSLSQSVRINVWLSPSARTPPWQPSNTPPLIWKTPTPGFWSAVYTSTYNITYHLPHFSVCNATEIRRGSKPISAARSAFILSRSSRMWTAATGGPHSTEPKSRCHSLPSFLTLVILLSSVWLDLSLFHSPFFYQAFIFFVSSSSSFFSLHSSSYTWVLLSQFISPRPWKELSI